jgi:hypothetical protein
MERGIDAINAAGLNPYCINEGRATGSERISTDWLDLAISSAKAAEEGVETVYVVEIDDGTGYGPAMFGARYEDLSDAEAKVARTLAAQHGSVKSTRILCEQKQSAVISVREKEGL